MEYLGVFLNGRIRLLIFIFFALSVRLFAGGISEPDEIKTQNDEWILCIANFEIDSIPDNRSGISGSIMRNLVESLNRISYRTRISPEYAFYEEAAWSRARSDAAKAIAAKQNERSLLVYRGDSNWRYLRNIERLDAEIEELRIALEEVENNVPLINNEPVFGLTPDNQEFKFPTAPVAGNEHRFCLDQKADAVLTGSITGFHERFIVSLKLYTVYTQSFVWEDSIIFSHDDLEDAMEEVMRRLLTVLSGNEPAVLTVRAEPEDALVLINQSFAGRGALEALEYPPGKITVTASAPHHESLTFETELFSAEQINISIGLRPIEYGNVDIDGVAVGRIYNGALYIGETPLTLSLPLNQMEFFELETPDNARSSIVFQVLGNNEFNYSLAMPAAVPSSSGRVDKARRMYYWAWGSTWIAGIAAWLTTQSYISSYNAISTDYYYTGSYNQNFYDSNRRMYYISMGSLIALGVSIAFDIFFMSRYIYSANKGATPIVK